MSTSKGGKYERQFIAMCDRYALRAKRTPLSGALPDYPDDVVVEDSVRVECKYRKDAANFSRLRDWMRGADSLLLPQSNLIVYSERLWTHLTAWRLWPCVYAQPTVEGAVKHLRGPQNGLLQWLGNAHALALRRAHIPGDPGSSQWVICERFFTC